MEDSSDLELSDDVSSDVKLQSDEEDKELQQQLDKAPLFMPAMGVDHSSEIEPRRKQLPQARATSEDSDGSELATVIATGIASAPWNSRMAVTARTEHSAAQRAAAVAVAARERERTARAKAHAAALAAEATQAAAAAAAAAAAEARGETTPIVSALVQDTEDEDVRLARFLQEQELEEYENGDDDAVSPATIQLSGRLREALGSHIRGSRRSERASKMPELYSPEAEAQRSQLRPASGVLSDDDDDEKEHEEISSNQELESCEYDIQRLLDKEHQERSTVETRQGQDVEQQQQEGRKQKLNEQELLSLQQDWASVVRGCALAVGREESNIKTCYVNRASLKRQMDAIGVEHVQTLLAFAIRTRSRTGDPCDAPAQASLHMTSAAKSDPCDAPAAAVDGTNSGPQLHAKGFVDSLGCKLSPIQSMYVCQCIYIRVCLCTKHEPARIRQDC